MMKNKQKASKKRREEEIRGAKPREPEHRERKTSRKQAKTIVKQANPRYQPPDPARPAQTAQPAIPDHPSQPARSPELQKHEKA